MKIYKENNELIVRIPIKQRENNCYVEEKDLNEVDALIGIVAKKKNGGDYSISYLNDLSYKNDVQEGMPILMFDTEDELRKVCNDIGIMVWEHSFCEYCGETIRGSFTIREKGNCCLSCEHK